MPATPDRVPIGIVSRLLGLSPSRVRQLVDEGVLPEPERTAGGHRRFDLAAVREAWARAQRARTPAGTGSVTPIWDHAYPLAGADEAAIWGEVRPHLDLGDTATSTAHYVVTEMVNNAIDHSRGTFVRATVGRANGHTAIEIIDDGEGLFHHLASGLGLDHVIDAMGELTKGKRTTDPARHTGEGIFFSSKAVDTYALSANGYRLTFDNVRDDIAHGTSPVTNGTSVRMLIDPRSTRSIRDLFLRFTDDSSFNRTRPHVRLFETGSTFVSRSEAKRLAAGLDEFHEVELDFAGVTDVGQGFADELFRVWAREHPGTALRPVGMNEAVAFMVERTRSTD